MKLISVLGPTSSGKSDLVVLLANDLNRKHGLNSTVIISCDSRQIYRGLNIGTGKIEGGWVELNLGEKLEQVYLYQQIPHFLIDFVDLHRQYGLYEYLSDFCKLFQNWSGWGFEPKFVILCGGTGLFAKAIVDQYQLEQFKSEPYPVIETLKAELSSYNANELQQILAQKTPNFKNILNNSDQNNPRRLINQIVRAVARENDWINENTLNYPKFESKFQFYLNPVDLKTRLKTRFKLRMEAGLIDESLALLQTGRLPPSKLLELGLEYREFWAYFIGLQTQTEFTQNCIRENWQYVRRQITWFKKQADLVEVQNMGDILRHLKHHEI